MVTFRTTSDEILTTADTRRGGVVATVRLDAPVRRPRVGGGRQVELRMPQEIDAIRASALIARAAVDAALRCAVVGALPSSLAAVVAGVIAAERAESVIQSPSFDELDADGRTFPAACCIAVNDRLIHAVPTDVPLCDGDVVTVDVAVRLRGWCADIADCVVVGTGSCERHAMISGCHEMLDVAVALIAPGVRWSRVARAMQDVAEARSLGLITGYAGHGVGRALHEAPVAPCALDSTFEARGDFTILPDMVLSVEPTVVQHPDGIRSVDADGFAIGVRLVSCEDGWTMRTESGAAGCSVERTVVVTRTGCEMLDEARASASMPMNHACHAGVACHASHQM